MAKGKGYVIMVGAPGRRRNLTVYSNHRTLASARKAGDRIADSFIDSTPIEIWKRADVDEVLQEGGEFAATAKSLGLKSVEEWE